jgi:hypothetical protein
MSTPRISDLKLKAHIVLARSDKSDNISIRRGAFVDLLLDLKDAREEISTLKGELLQALRQRGEEQR